MDSPTVTPEGELNKTLKIPSDEVIAKKSRHTHADALDSGTDHAGKYRKHWYQLWLPSDPPPPPPQSLDDAPVTPLASASIISKLTYHWITPMITLGYQRPLQAPDLWKMDESREAGLLSSKLDEAWSRRVAKANEWNELLAQGKVHPPIGTRLKWRAKALFRMESVATQETRWRAVEAKKTASLPWALNDVLGPPFWAGGLFKVLGDTCQLMGPLVSRALINLGKERETRQAAGEPPPNIGRGVGMAIGLFLLTITFSTSTHQFFWRSMNTGVLARCALISSLYKRGMKLTPRARSMHSNAALMNHMSTDISRIDFAAQWFHAIWTAPIQITLCIALLLVQLGPSALAGFSVFVMLIPIQQHIMARQLAIRRKSMKWTDQRASLLQELLSAMRVIKYFCYEVPFLERLDYIRHQELIGIRKILIIKALNQAIAFSVPALASILAFAAYTLSGHPIDPAVIFTSLALFQLLRQPLMFLPRAISAYTDAENAFQRLTPVFYAETLEDTTTIDLCAKLAVCVEDADFQWEEPPPSHGSNEKKRHHHPFRKNRPDIVDHTSGTATPATPASHEPFALRSMTLKIPRGQLSAIAGPVGSGKSSLLLALIGEMKQTRGNRPVFGGTVGYCAQTAWIQNASVRENILFGAEFEEDRYWRVIQDAALLSDLEILPDGDLTEIGEKGINLSGGQKQRVNIARALYHDADIVILDDPLSAVDAHVGEALFTNAILNALKHRGKTVILVTHALHFLHQVDYIYNVVDGVIVEQGTYDTLVANGAAFAHLLQEFSGSGSRESDVEGEEALIDPTDHKKPTKRRASTLQEVKQKLDMKNLGKAAGTGKIEGRLMKAEKRTVGSIDRNTYTTYIKSGRGYINVPLILLSAVLMQGAQIMNSYWLIWWQLDKFHRTTQFYMGLYAALGVSQAIFTFALGGTMAILSFYACVNLHRQAIHKVFHAPMSFFDTTPLGRILGVFGKDIDTIDNFLSDSLRMFAMTMASALGAIVIITYLEHYFVLIVGAVMIGYSYFAAYYRVSARELKRLDASLRSLLYSHFAESLSGLSTIRAYGTVARFLRDNEYYNDLEDRALFLTCTNQRWLAIRLDFMGALLIFCVAMMAAAGVNGINPAEIGLVLVYCVSLTQMFGMVTRQSAEVENYMNAVERTVHYTRDDLIEQEPPHVIEKTKPPSEWPSHGAIQFIDVHMSYRPGLPSVLNGINLSILPGEKVGVVGRTGAGKSSFMIALYRLMELSGGSIRIDGVDISGIGLRDLRSKLSIIPQDPLLFSGTVRSNLDPFSRFDDAKLYDALRRAHLVAGPSTSGTASPTETLVEKGRSSRFTLDMAIDAEGANLSVGERSLLSLARALVRDDIRIVIMDEATASVDIETDNAIQTTISQEFGEKTLLCIAHRLRTIIHYDRVLVLDAGQVKEYDTPITLFRKPDGLFRSLCQQSKITEQDILNADKHAIHGTLEVAILE